MKTKFFYLKVSIFLAVFAFAFCFEVQAGSVNDKEHQEFLSYLKDAQEGHPIA